MKIDPTSVAAQDTLALGTSKAAPAAKTAVPAAATKAAEEQGRTAPDHVNLSGLLEKLRHSDVSGSEVSPERVAHLNQLREQVASGSYEVDSAKLSSKIVDDTINGIG